MENFALYWVCSMAEVCRGIRGQTNDPHEHTHTHTHSLASTRIGATALATTSIRDK